MAALIRGYAAALIAILVLCGFLATRVTVAAKIGGAA
jgi:hypothetical protein